MDAFFDEQSNCLCIVMELANNGDILNKINNSRKTNCNIDENEIWKAFKDMTLG